MDGDNIDWVHEKNYLNRLYESLLGDRVIRE